MSCDRRATLCCPSVLSAATVIDERHLHVASSVVAPNRTSSRRRTLSEGQRHIAVVSCQRNTHETHCGAARWQRRIPQQSGWQLRSTTRERMMKKKIDSLCRELKTTDIDVLRRALSPFSVSSGQLSDATHPLNGSERRAPDAAINCARSESAHEDAASDQNSADATQTAEWSSRC